MAGQRGALTALTTLAGVVVLVPLVLLAAADEEAVPGEARATAVGYAQRTSQPGATLLGDTIAEGQVPLASVRVQAVGSGALASVAYPGALVANADALVEGVPSYPAQARAVYPPSGTVTSDASQQVSSAPGLEVGTMTARARQRSAAAHAAGVDAAAGGQAGSPDTSVFRSQSLGTDAAAFVDGADVLVARATSSGRGVLLAGGVVRIGAFTSTVEAKSDGARGAGVATTTVEGVMVGGVGVVLDQDGLHVAGAGLSPLATLLAEAQVQGVLNGVGLDVRAAPALAGAEPGAPGVGVAETGGVAVTATLPNGVVQRFTLGAAAARAALSGTGLTIGDDVALGGPLDVSGPAAPASPGSAGLTSGAALAPTLGPSLSVAPPPGPALSFGVDAQPLSSRRGVGDRVWLAALAVVMGTGLLLGYARWQLLDWLLGTRTDSGG